MVCAHTISSDDRKIAVSAKGSLRAGGDTAIALYRCRCSWQCPSSTILYSARYHVLEGTDYVSGGMNMLPAKLKQVGYATHQVGKCRNPSSHLLANESARTHHMILDTAGTVHTRQCVYGDGIFMLTFACLMMTSRWFGEGHLGATVDWMTPAGACSFFVVNLSPLFFKSSSLEPAASFFHFIRTKCYLHQRAEYR